MRWQPCKMALLVGLCVIGLTGCAKLRLGKDKGPFDVGMASVASSSSGGSLFKSEEASSAAAAEALSKEKKDPYEGQFSLVRLSERRGETEQAEKDYNDLLRQKPNDSRIYHRIAAMAVAKGDFAKAEQYFAKAVSLAPPTPELLSDVGYCHYLQHKLPEAESVLNEALKLDATYAPAVNNLALVVGRQGRTKESLDLFRRANSEAEAYANVAYVLSQNGDLAQSQQMYLRALTLDNNMKAAAQAALQIREREDVKKRLASMTAGSVPIVSPDDRAGQGMAEPSRLPEVEGGKALTLPVEKRSS